VLSPYILKRLNRKRDRTWSQFSHELPISAALECAWRKVNTPGINAQRRASPHQSFA
jgi:hypothetical protein